MDKKSERKNDTVYIEQWLYRKPQLTPNQDGNIVLISKGCFGPLEVYEWGIDADRQAYERYEWLENEFYQYDNYRIKIEWKRLRQQIQNVIVLFRNNGFPDWAEQYETILDHLNQEMKLM